MDKKRVFVSHNPYFSHLLATRLFHMLQSDDLDLLLVSFDRSFTNSPPNPVHDAWVQHSHVFMTILTPPLLTGSHINDVWFWREIEHAINLHIPIVTILAYGFTFPDVAPPQVAELISHLAKQPFLHFKSDKVDDELHFLRATIMSLPKPTTQPFIANPQFAELDDVRKASLMAGSVPTDDQILAERALNEGIMATHQGEFQNAIEHYNRAIKRYPDFYNAYNSRAIPKAITGDLQGALDDLTHCIEIDEKNFRGYANRGNVQMQMGRMDDALLDYSKAINMNQHSSLPYNNRGFARYNIGDYRGAVRDCTDAIRINPKNFNGYDSRGYAYFALGKFTEALADFEMALKMRPNHAESIIGSAIAYHALDDIDGAKQCWESFIGIVETKDVEKLAAQFLWTAGVREAVEKLVSLA